MFIPPHVRLVLVKFKFQHVRCQAITPIFCRRQKTIRLITIRIASPIISFFFPSTQESVSFHFNRRSSDERHEVTRLCLSKVTIKIVNILILYAKLIVKLIRVLRQIFQGQRDEIGNVKIETSMKFFFLYSFNNLFFLM